MLCKSFLDTLLDSASKWFNDLKPSSITSFAKLVRLFITYYASNKPLKKESYHLFSIVQSVDESVEAFMKRFHKEKIEISNCFDGIAIQAFR